MGNEWFRNERNAEISDLLGTVISSIEVGNDKTTIDFELSDGRSYRMYHDQDCCETCSIEDIVGDMNDLLGSPITMAEEAWSKENPLDKGDESFTWTFYKLATVKGYVTIRWYGSSNGYYSESADFIETRKTA